VFVDTFLSRFQNISLRDTQPVNYSSRKIIINYPLFILEKGTEGNKTLW